MATWDTPTIRCDGLMLRKTAETNWVIIPGRGLPVTECPIYHEPLQTSERARKLADALFPVEPDPPMAA